MVWKWLVFVVLTIPIIYVSWASLRNPRSHGFYRFFAWECILGLFLLNVDHWFESPFAPWQLVSWILLLLSIVPVVWGTLLLRKKGRPVEKRPEDPSLLAFEKTTQLVTTGIYRHIRHPLYSSLLLLAWGTFFKVPSWIGFILALAASLFLVATARADETECIQFFGQEYRDYMRKTKRFIPYIF